MTYAELASVPRGRIVGVLRHPQCAHYSSSPRSLWRWACFSGTIITEQVFTYPGLGSPRRCRQVNAGDTTTVLAVSSISDRRRRRRYLHR